jgi:hypothetical protein
VTSLILNNLSVSARYFVYLFIYGLFNDDVLLRILSSNDTVISYKLEKTSKEAVVTLFKVLCRDAGPASHSAVKFDATR